MCIYRLCSSIILALAITAVAVQPVRGWAQGAGAPPGPAETHIEETVATAPVTVDGVMLFKVRGVSSFPAAERAQAVTARIVAVAANPSFNPDALRIEETEMASRILADGQVVIAMYDSDGRIEGVRRQVLAKNHTTRIRDAIIAYRADRSAPALQRAAVRALVATAAAVALLIAVIWLWRRLDTALESRYRKRVEDLTAKSHDVVSAQWVWTSLRNMLQFVRSAILAVLGFILLGYLLALFPQTRQIAWSLTGWVLNPIITMGASFVATIPKLIFLSILFLVVRFLLALIRRFFEAIEQGRLVLGQFEREWALPTYKLFRLLVISFAVVVGYPYIPGSNSDAFKGVSLFLGIVFSLGSSSFLANMVAGYSLNYRRLFKVGDRVQIGDVQGEVSALRLQVTHLRTIRNEQIVVPNSVILNTHLVNYSTLAREKGLVLSTKVGIGYETPWRQVEAMLIEAARRTPGALKEPAPFVRQLTLADFAVTYALSVYTDEPLRMEDTYTDLHRNVLDVFNEYGVQIMTPAYKGDPKTPKVVPRDQWYAAPAKPEPPQ
jgi:small-conductance mechanosensitive channel